jgi:hypothetical protein
VFVEAVHVSVAPAVNGAHAGNEPGMGFFWKAPPTVLSVFFFLDVTFVGPATKNHRNLIRFGLDLHIHSKPD